MGSLQLFFNFLAPEVSVPKLEDYVCVGGDRLPLQFKKNPHAKHYLIYVRSQGIVSVTIPRGGGVEYARSFVKSKVDWIQRQWMKRKAASLSLARWEPGTKIFLNGQLEPIMVERVHGDWEVRVGSLRETVSDLPYNLRSLVEAMLVRHAGKVLPTLVERVAELHGMLVRGVKVRNQKTRWGSCSHLGNISLNWRLIQTPPEVQNYIIIHELMHLKEMNHSARYWALVEKACPHYKDHEQWLKIHTARLGM